MTSLGHNELTTFEAILHKTGQIWPKSCHLLRKKKWWNNVKIAKICYFDIIPPFFFPHPPVITPENLRNERKKGQTTIHKAAWPQLKISIPFTWFSFQFQEFQFQFHKFPISPIPVLKLELSHNSNFKTELPPNPEYYGSHFLVFLIRQYVWNTHLSLIGVIGENVTHTPRDTHTHRTHTHTTHHTPHTHTHHTTHPGSGPPPAMTIPA